MSYKNTTHKNTDKLYQRESLRELITLLVFFFYLGVLLLTFVGFFKRWPTLILTLSILLLISLPGLLIFEGYNSIFFLVYSDMCDAVHGAIYENQFPIYQRSLGYFASCFDIVKYSYYNII
jgi:hypothetical protein